MNQEIMNSNAIGSCTDNRFVYSQGSTSDRIDWSLHQEKLLDLFLEFYQSLDTVSCQSPIIAKVEEIIMRLIKSKVDGKSEFCGVGPMNANQFVHLASLVGLIPLYCFNCAEINNVKLGPGRAISIGVGKKNMSLQDVCTSFKSMYSKLKTIWNDAIIMSLVENMLCEISRCYRKTVKNVCKLNESKGLKNAVDVTNLSVICDESLMLLRQK